MCTIETNRSSVKPPAISVSAGVRGAQLILSPADYIRATNATAGPIAKEK
jgi:prolyl-tRNA editing enzyme YbaK/EbsC (Cys-tRNA(Pro) deacylase)